MKGMVYMIVNLTPYKVVIVKGEYNTPFVTIEPSGTVASISYEETTLGEFEGIPILKKEYGEVEELPEPKDDTIYIVSHTIAQLVPERKDVFIPGKSVSDNMGRIVGCKCLTHI